MSEGGREEWNTFRVKHTLLVSFKAVGNNKTNCGIVTGQRSSVEHN